MSQAAGKGYGKTDIRTRRNVRIDNRRTSVKLEPEMWDALVEISVRTKKNLNEICTEVYRASHGSVMEAEDRDLTQSANFTSDLRVFILDYFRASAR